MSDPALAIGDRNPQLSPNFWLDEFHCRDGTPVPEASVEGLRSHTRRNLQPIRDFFDSPMVITSGYRTPEYNKGRGVERSWHLYGTHGDQFATDFVVAGYTPAEIGMVLSGLIRLGVIDEGGIGVYQGFVHYDNRGWRARW